MARASTSRNNWFTDKKVTYHRSVSKERAERIREAKAQRREQKSAEARRRRELLEELKDDAYSAGQSDRSAGRKGSPYRISLLTSPRWEAAFGKAKARTLVTSAYKSGYRRNPETCARTVKSKVTDRAKRYRANQPGCRPSGLKKCKLCGSRSDVMVDHADGNESNGKKSNLRWLCRSCNNTLGAEMAKSGVGRRTVQYNPAHKGAQTLGEYMQAVLQHTRGSHDAAGRIIHETPKARRREFASEIWARRESHGTARGSGDEPDWVTNPANPSTENYTLVLYEGLSRRGDKHSFFPGTLELAQRKAQEYADDMGLDAVLYGPDGRMLGRFATSRPHSWRRNPAGGTVAGKSGGSVNGGLSQSNPEDSEEYRQAQKIAELFHGRPVKEEITVTESIREHDWLWRIGPLVELKVKVLSMKRKAIPFPFSQTDDAMVHLFCSPDGRQFYLRGGDQELNLDAIKMGKGTEWFRDHMLIGEVTYVTYRDKKRFHSFKIVDYFHRLGEETKKKPTLAYDAFAHKLQIVGGQYRIETKDLVDGMSPGIVN